MNLLLNFVLMLCTHLCAGVPLTERAYAELCPVIGYHGAFCPGSTGQIYPLQRTTTGFVQNGIGMTIDLSTGEIKLPALQLTYNARSMVPYEVILTNTNNPESFEPDVHIFKTEQDLI